MNRLKMTKQELDIECRRLRVILLAQSETIGIAKQTLNEIANIEMEIKSKKPVNILDSWLCATQKRKAYECLKRIL